MPNLEIALIEFAKLIGLLAEDGDVQWAWFANPVQQALVSMPTAAGDDQATEDHVGGMLRALLDRDPAPSPTFPLAEADPSVTRKWEVLLDGPPGVGITWDKNPPALNALGLGIGAALDTSIANQPITLAAVLKLFRVAPGGISAEFGSVHFGGTFPVPDFLQSGSIAGDVIPGAPVPFTVGLTATESPQRSRTLAFPSTELPWDSARLATFIVEAWIRKSAQAGAGEFFERAVEHLFPMFGEPPPQPIGLFPLFQPSGTSASFEEWTQSVVTPDNDAQGALTFLWHLRALLTGNEDSSFLGGSVYFPLGAGPPQGSPPTPADKIPNQYPPPAGTPGGWFGIDENGNAADLVLDLRTSGGQSARVTLASATGSTITRPNVTAEQMNAVAALPASIPLQSGQQITNTPAGNTRRLRILTQSLPGPPGVGGDYHVDIVVEQGQPVSYVAEFPALALPLPPPQNATALVNAISDWLLTTAANLAGGGQSAEYLDAVRVLVQQALSGSLDAEDVLPLLATIVGSSLTLEAGPLEIGFSGTVVNGALTIAPVAIEGLGSTTLKIGALEAAAGVNVESGALSNIALSLTDIRFVSNDEGGVSGIIGTLLPDLTDVPGFFLALKWENPPDLGGLHIEGGGKIPIQRQLGPLTLVALLIEVRTESFTLGLDLTFEIGPILVSAYNLGLRVPFESGPVEPFLDGLGLSLDTSALKLTGLFGKVETDGLTDYVGGVVVSVVDLFELSAIGGYTQLDNGEASLFIFASLVAPLGGPPYFFITGVAGGFGYNRTLPPASLLYEHPFIQVMNGELDLSGGVGKVLTTLSAQFEPRDDAWWIAGGLQFISFGFIHGKVIVAVEGGHEFSFSLLGLAGFGIESVAYFELAVSTTVSETMFEVRAGMSPNSYLIHPDVFSLRGDFAMCVWYGDPAPGDFVLSIGGYHPYFTVPAHYPSLHRVAVKASVFGFLNLSVECFFACTPKALMAGASISLWAEFGDIAAGLDIYFDVFIGWDPFYLTATLGVAVWFEFMGRHEIGVELQIHTPPFGGLALVDLAIVSFEIEFGEKPNELPPPKISEFIAEKLGVPAAAKGLDGATVRAFSDDGEAGLLKLDILEGRAARDQAPEGDKQEGLASRIALEPEFVFAVRTRLPIDTKNKPAEVTGPDNKKGVQIAGHVDLTLCERPDLETSLTIFAPNINKIPIAEMDEISDEGISATADFFPASEFGGEITEVQGDGARQAVADVKTDDAVISLLEGLIVRYAARLDPADDTVFTAKNGEESEGQERYPLPLGWLSPNPQVFRTPKAPLLFSNIAAGLTIARVKKNPGRQVLARAALQSRRPVPLRVFSHSASFARAEVLSRLRGNTLPALPQGVAVIAPPSSPLRGAELFPVSLRLVPPHTPVPIVAERLTTITRANARKGIVRSDTDAPGTFSSELRVASGRAVHVDLTGDRVRRGGLRISGRQIVRVIALSGGDEVLADTYAPPAGALNLPPRCRRLVLIGEGLHAPVARDGAAEESVGLEHDTRLLAIGRRTFAAHGCVITTAVPLREGVRLLDTVPAFRLLRQATNLRIVFPPVRAGWSLVLSVAPIATGLGDGPRRPGSSVGTAQASALSEVRWLSIGAGLSGLHTIVGPERTDFIMSVTSRDPWALEIDLGRNWRLAAVIVAPGTPRDHANSRRTLDASTLVDDAVERTEAIPPTTVRVEVTP